MKKLFVTSVLIISMIGAAFAQNSFGHRFFEIKVHPEVNVSENLMSIDEILKKEVVIDLSKIADSMSNDGLRVVANAKPALEINLDIPHGLLLGFEVGAQLDSGIGLSKDIFDFLGNGNGDKPVDIKAQATNSYADLFWYVSVPFGWNGENLKWKVTPSFFSAMAHLDASKSYVQVYNNEDGVFGYKAHADVTALTNFDLAVDNNSSGPDLNELLGKNGFDIAGDVELNVFKFLSVGVNARVPLAASQLTRSTGIQADFEGSVSVSDLFNSDDADPTPDPDPNGDPDGNNKGPDIPPSVLLEDPYKIHRPLKFAVGVDFHPVGNLLSDYAAIGIGVRHPFAKDKTETKAYIDYLVGTRLSLWNILILDVSHAREDEIFKNKATLGLNLRLVEADIGVSLQSVDFAKSFSGAGLGVDLAICIGF